MSEQLLIKSFTIKKFRISRTTSIERCMDLTAEYIFRIYKNTNEDVEIIDHENQFEDDLMAFIRELSSPREGEIQENIRISEIRAMENLLMREIFIVTLSALIGRTAIDIDEYRKLRARNS